MNNSNIWSEIAKNVEDMFALPMAGNHGALHCALKLMENRKPEEVVRYLVEEL